MRRSRVALPVVLVLLAAACGKSAEEERFEEISALCFGLAGEGATWEQAYERLLPHNSPGFLDCQSQYLNLPNNQSCEAWTQENPQCAIYLVWIPNDPSLCRSSSGGCCLSCELRLMGDQLQGLNRDAPICASQFIYGASIPGVC
jgi:hypothetical protein